MTMKHALVLLALTMPVTAQAQTMTECMMARNQGMISPACGKLLGLSDRSAQPPEDNGGVHLKQTLSYMPLGNRLGNASILGLSLGMTQEKATQTLRNWCLRDPNIVNTAISTTYKGAHVETQFFPRQMQCSKGDDTIEITLSSPVMGAVVTQIERNVSFAPDNAPTFATLQEEVAGKYGLHLPVPGPYGEASRQLYANMAGQEIEGVIHAVSPRSEDVSTYDVPGETGLLQVRLQSVSGNPANIGHISFDLHDMRAERMVASELLKQLNASVDAKLGKASSLKPEL